jgi:16S rRNA (cytosine967-C5)-methyltransferase
LAKVSIAREIAYDVFIKALEDGLDPQKESELLYEKHSGKLKRLDKNFVKEIVFGSLRWYSKIYWILQNVSKRDLDKSTPEIRAALICGTYQIFYMDRVPDRAAVNESVEYIRAKSQANAVTFVNGILRQIARKSQYFPKPDKKTKPNEYLALQFSHPRWIVDRWSQTFKFDKLAEMLAANNKQPPISIRINTMKTNVENSNDLMSQLLKEEKIKSDRRPLRSAITLKSTPLFSQDSMFGRGLYTVQDEASQLIGYIVDPKEGETVVDACAGSGGKLSHLFELSEGKADLTGIDPDPAAMKRGQETLARLGHEGVKWETTDFLDWKPSKAPNKILLDAPCSGLGVLRRHPEGKWHKDLATIHRMQSLQRRLIEHAIGLLEKGGELIYSVCSFEKEETEDQLKWVLDNFGDQVELQSPVSRLPDYYKRYVTRGDMLHIYAGNNDNADGFGAFILVKK